MASPAVTLKCLAWQMYQRAASSYRRGFLSRSSEELRAALLAAPDETAVQQLLFPDFARFALASYADEISAYRCAESGLRHILAV
jgi:hypothetical protein